MQIKKYMKMFFYKENQVVSIHNFQDVIEIQRHVTLNFPFTFEIDLHILHAERKLFLLK